MISAKTDHTLAELQRAVQHKVGGCLLRLQEYELLLKEMLAGADFEGDPAQWQTMRDKQRASVQNKTLGDLAKLFASKYLAAEAPPATEMPPAMASSDTRIWLRFQQRVVMNDEHYEALCNDLKQLVSLRNELVHHFLQRFDVIQLESCHAAVAHLDQSRASIEEQYKTLKNMALHAIETNKYYVAFLQSEAFADALKGDAGLSARKLA